MVEVKARSEAGAYRHLKMMRAPAAGSVLILARKRYVVVAVTFPITGRLVTSS